MTEPIDYHELTDTEARAFLDGIRKEAKRMRRSRYYKSALDRYKAEIFQLRRSGAMPLEVFRYLKYTQKLHIRSLSTVTRWLQKHEPEYEQALRDLRQVR